VTKNESVNTNLGSECVELILKLVEVLWMHIQKTITVISRVFYTCYTELCPPLHHRPRLCCHVEQNSSLTHILLPVTASHGW